MALRVYNTLTRSKELVKKKHAYVADGDIFYALKSFEGYGKLSGWKPDEQFDGIWVAVDEKKRDPQDFTLWKASKPGEPEWPFKIDGKDIPGRPGWHIECSVMAPKQLGDTVDIHGGGMDLIFPHHENEIAQSEAYSGKPFVKYWLHNSMVHFGADKMSKSLGNVVPINDLIEKYSGEVVRFYILTSHYRSPLNYAGEKTIEEARTALDRLYTACDLVKAWTEAEANDEALFEIADDAEASELQSFGIVLNADGMTWTVSEISPENGDTFEKLVKLNISVRERLRSRKVFDISDKIRDMLKNHHVLLEDGKAGTTWRVVC